MFNAYGKAYDVCLALKIIGYKLYSNLKLIFISSYFWKKNFIDLVTGLWVLLNWKVETFDLILVIMNLFTKMVYYKLVTAITNAMRLAKIKFNMIVWYSGFFDLYYCQVKIIIYFKVSVFSLLFFCH